MQTLAAATQYACSAACAATGDGYVHRLIQSKTDGKLVEVPSPAPAACRHRTPHNSRGGACDPDPGSRRRTEDQEDSEGCPHCQDEQQVRWW